MENCRAIKPLNRKRYWFEKYMQKNKSRRIFKKEKIPTVMNINFMTQ